MPEYKNKKQDKNENTEKKMCIRDSYQAMRVTGAADPTRPMYETMHGKLPQRRIVTDAAHGYSSYGNQLGLATCLLYTSVSEGSPPQA